MLNLTVRGEAKEDFILSNQTSLVLRFDGVPTFLKVRHKSTHIVGKLFQNNHNNHHQPQ